MRATIEGKRRIGRPSKLDQIERRLGQDAGLRDRLPIEHYVLAQMTKARTSEQIAGSLRIHPKTLQRWLRRRGFRIHCSCKLEPIDASRPGQSPEGPGADAAGPE